MGGIFINNGKWLGEYIGKTESGEIIIGFELSQMLQKLKKEIFDIEYQKSQKIIIDYSESDKRISFIENECKHYEAPFSGKPFILMLFQKAFIEAIFAIKIWDDELQRYVRKYQNVLFLVGRKNGKTPLIGSICLAEWFCGPMGLRILCGSNDYEQAALMFDAMNAMREESPKLARVTRKNIKGMFFGGTKQKKKKGKFSSQNKGTIKKISAKSGAKEGRNIGIGAVDEVFEMQDASLVMPIRQALSTQDEPLYFELTTEGFVNGGYLDDRLIEARKILNKEIVDEASERWLIWLYTQDSEEEIYRDENSWQKSNPGIGVIKKKRFLMQMLDEAKQSTSKRAYVLAKDFNIKLNTAEAWLKKEWINCNHKIIEIEDLPHKIAMGGVDLSESGDLTNARILIADTKTKEKIFFTQYFIPEDKMEENIKYTQWVKDGYIRTCEGSEVSQGDVAEWLIETCKRNKIKMFKIGYDKWQAKGFREQMEDYGFELEKIQQGEALSNAMNIFENDLKSGRVVMQENPVDKWCLENMAVKWNPAGTKRQPVKIKGDQTKKIDGGVTMLICYETLDRFRGQYMEYAEQNQKK